MAEPSFTTEDALSVVFQMSNYGAPDTDLTVDYAFYRLDGPRRLFNRTNPQLFSDEDLPPPRRVGDAGVRDADRAAAAVPAWALRARGGVSDRLTRGTAPAAVAFSVVSGVR